MGKSVVDEWWINKVEEGSRMVNGKIGSSITHQGRGQY